MRLNLRASWRTVALLWLAALSLPSIAAAKLNLFITIDTETSSGCTEQGCYPVPLEDRVLGLLDGKAYGIDLIMGMLEAHGMRGTFFVNAYLDSYYPDEEIRAFIQRIVTRGHDVQFHAHEEFRCFAVCAEDDLDCRNRCLVSDGRLVGNTYEKQVAILDEGARNLQRWTGEWPLAFRGGAYRISTDTLRALKSLNIEIDSSVGSSTHHLAELFEVNRLSVHEGVIELPILEFKALGIGSFNMYRQMDLESNTFLEMRRVIDQSIDLDLSMAMTIMHSFSFCRKETGDCPHERNIAEFEALLSYVASRPDIRVLTVKEFAHEYAANPESFAGSGAIPTTGYWMTLYRSLVRIDEGWKNVIFAMANVGLLFGLTAVAWLAHRRRVRRLAAVSATAAAAQRHRPT